MSTPEADYAVKFYQGKGYSREQAIGIVANLMQESNLNPNEEGDFIGKQPTAFGVGQWRGERFQRLKQFAADSKSSWTNLDTQLAFVDHELKNNETDAYDKLKAAKTVGEATAAVIYYERPAAFNPDDPYNSPEFRWRMAHADAIAGGPTAVASGSSGPVSGVDAAPAARQPYRPPFKTGTDNPFTPIQDMKAVDVFKVPPPIPWGETKLARGLTPNDIFNPVRFNIPDLPPIPPAPVPAIDPVYVIPTPPKRYS